MKEQLIVLKQQMIYSRNRENVNMSDGATSPDISVGEEQQEIKKPNKEKLAQDPKQEKLVDKGIKEYAKKYYKKKEEKEKKASGKPQDQTKEEEKAQAPPKHLEMYFEEAPTQDPELIQHMEDFYKDANQRSLDVLEADFLVKHYLFLQKQAGEKNISSSFLAKIQKNLVNRGVDLNAVVLRSLNLTDRIENTLKKFKALGWELTDEQKELLYQGIPVAGGARALNLDGIDDPKLRSLGEAINEQVAILEREDYETLNNRYDQVLAFNGEVDPEQKKELLRQISLAMKRARAEEIKGRGERPYGEFYGERRITTSEEEEVEAAINEILASGEKGNLGPIEKLFNRMFDYADSTPQKEFDKALGTAGSQEHHHWITMLNKFRGKAAEEAERTNEFERLDLITRLIQKYQQEYRVRELLHNTYFIVETGGDPKNFVEYSSSFLSEFADLALQGSPEVEIAYRAREQVLYQIKRENYGTIPPETVALRYSEEKDRFESEFEVRSTELLRKTLKANGMNLPLWKVDRALSISRGLGMVLLRWPEIIAECTLQAPSDTNEAQPSIPWEKLSWELNPLDHKVKRYKIGREIMAVLHAAVTRQHPKRKFLDLWNQDELTTSMNFNSITALAEWDRGRRMIDIRNLSRIGGWATYSGWRSWVSALEREGGSVSLALADLQKTLGRNPGLSIRLLWNRYEEGDLGRRKKEFLREYGYKQGVDENSVVALKAWEAIEKEEKAKVDGEEKNKTVWKEADVKTWKSSAKRIPHVILRVLTDEANKIYSKAEIKALIKDIFGALPEAELKKIYTQTETDLTLAKERVMKRRRDFREQNPKAEFPEGEDEITPDDLRRVIEATAEDGDVEKRIERALKLKKIVEERMENKDLQKILFDKMSNREFAYALTTEDTPLGEFRFVQAGARGLVTRRNNDFLQEIQANEAQYGELLNQLNLYKSPEQVVEQLTKIFKAAQVHDYSRALELIEFWAKGIIRFNQKDGILKVPIFGEIWGALNLLRRRGQSYSQTAYGRSGMSWDSDDIYNFTEQLRKNIFIGEEGYAILQRIRKETGGTIWHAIGKKTKTAIYLFMLFFSYEMAKKLAEGK